MFGRFLSEERGGSGAEYALILTIIGVGIGAAALVLGNNVAVSIGDAPSSFDDGVPGTDSAIVKP